MNSLYKSPESGSDTTPEEAEKVDTHPYDPKSRRECLGGESQGSGWWAS